MNDMSETTILEEGKVKITNLRAIIGTKTYPISNITSVNLITKPLSFGPGCLIGYGVLFLFVTLIYGLGKVMSPAVAAETFLVALLLIGAGIWHARSTKSWS